MTDLTQRRQAERHKYELIYAGHAPHSARYGASDHFQPAAQRIRDLGARSVLDVGCGRGGFCRWCFHELQMHSVCGVDFALPADCETIAVDDHRYLQLTRDPAHALPFTDREFDLVTAWDVLEHLLPDEVDDVLAEMARVGKRWLALSIAHTPARRQMQGQTYELRPTVRPIAWWMERIERVTGASWDLIPGDRHWSSYLLCRLPGSDAC